MSLLLLFTGTGVAVARRYILGGVTIKSPASLIEANQTQALLYRTLQGTWNKDLFGSNKRIWSLRYENVSEDDYMGIFGKYEIAIQTGQPITWEIIQENYPIAETSVYVDMTERDFYKGESYYSTFNLILTEA